MNNDKEHILVIRLGALGDLVFCFQSFHEIRRAHPDAEIALLTRAPFAAFAAKMPWFDRIIIDTHPATTDIGGWLKLRKEIKSFAPTRIYDLQGKTRQTILYALLGGPFAGDWSGAAPLCTFPRPWPPQPDAHFTQFLADQLRAAGVEAASPFDISWLDTPTEKFALPTPYILIVPGCSPHAPHKRWPANKYAALAKGLQKRGVACVAVGTESDAPVIAAIKTDVPDLVDLCGKTSLFELASLARHAACVVGNDTGPVHLAAATGAPVLALFSKTSNPVWSKPPGAIVACLESPDLADLKVSAVGVALDILLNKAENAAV